MKCPLLMLTGDITNQAYDDCVEGKCAWWDEASERCAVLMIAVDMDRAVSQANDLCINLVTQLGNLNENLIKR